MSGRLLLMRHGRTSANADRRLMGRDDPPLDEVGRRQVAEAAAALAAEVRVDLVVTSPLRRARQTAAIVAGGSIRTLVDPDLAEVDFGRAAGGDPDGPRPKLRMRTAHRHVPPPGGESLHQAWLRASRALDSLTPELDAGRQVLVVSHYRLGQLLAGVLSRRPFDEAMDAVRLDEFRTASIHVVAGLRFDEEGDVRHLAASGIRRLGSPASRR